MSAGVGVSVGWKKAVIATASSCRGNPGSRRCGLPEVSRTSDDRGLHLLDGGLEPFGVLADAFGDQRPVNVVVAERAAVAAHRFGVEKQLHTVKVRVGGAQLLFDSLQHISFRGVAHLDQTGPVVCVPPTVRSHGWESLPGSV